MEVIRETVYEYPYASKQFDAYFGVGEWAVLDIETTGLSPRTSKVILVGLCLPCDDHMEAIQFFAHSRGEECELLEALDRFLTGSVSLRTLVTYNGNAFDLPYLRERYRANQMVPHWMPIGSLDLYRAVRYYSPLKQILPNLKQKSVETYLGLQSDRTDEIDGEESVRLYLDYEIFGNPEERERILLHNRDDIVQLSRLMTVLDKLDLHAIVRSEGLAIAPEDGRTAGKLAVWESLTPARGVWTVSGSLRRVPTDYFAFENGYSAAFYANKERKEHPGSHRNDRAGTFTVEVAAEERDGCAYVRLTDFPEELWKGEAGEACKALLERSPHRAGDYLILSANGQVHDREVNALLQRIVQMVLSKS